MRRVKIFDTTLRDGEQAPGFNMHESEKTELSVQLRKLGVDIIEAGFASYGPADFRSIKKIAENTPDAIVCSLSRCKKSDIDLSYDALKNALVSPRIHLFLPTSPIHLSYSLKMSEERALNLICDSVKYAKSLVSDVQFSCEDATRSDRDFLIKAIIAAIENGATTINLPDTVGYSHPAEIEEMFTFVLSHVPDADKITFATHCHNDLGLAVANSLAAIKAGATQLECTLNGIGERAGNAAMEEVCMALKTRRDYFDADTGINTRQIYNASRLLSSITGIRIPPTKPLIGKNAFAHESGVHQLSVLTNKQTYEIIEPSDLGIVPNAVVLGRHSGKHAFKDYIIGMGVSPTDEELDRLYAEFLVIADKKKTVSHNDIEYLLSHSDLSESKCKVKLDNYGITTVNGSALANITLVIDDDKKTGGAAGDGPIDAAFKAINNILGRDFRLVDWSVSAITEGEDAVGAATLRLKFNDLEVTGRGISTDTVEASLVAYLNGCNKILEMIP